MIIARCICCFPCHKGIKDCMQLHMHESFKFVILFEVTFLDEARVVVAQKLLAIVEWNGMTTCFSKSNTNFNSMAQGMECLLMHTIISCQLNFFTPDLTSPFGFAYSFVFMIVPLLCFAPLSINIAITLLFGLCLMGFGWFEFDFKLSTLLWPVAQLPPNNRCSGFSLLSEGAVAPSSVGGCLMCIKANKENKLWKKERKKNWSSNSKSSPESNKTWAEIFLCSCK